VEEAARAEPTTVDLQQPPPCIERGIPNLVSNAFYHDNPR
jgi:hypothetical protein